LFGGAALAGKRAMLLFTTGGSSEAFRPGGAFSAVDDFLFHIQGGMLEFVGYHVLEPVIPYGSAHLTDEERAAALEAVQGSVALTSRASRDRAGRRDRTAEAVTPRRTAAGAVALPRSRSAASEGEPGSAV